MKTVFNPKGWLVFFAVLHTFMFLVPQLFATSTVIEMNWGALPGPEHAVFYEQMLGTLGIGYTPMLLGMAFLTEGATRARLTLVTAVGMAFTAGTNTAVIMGQPGYAEGMEAFLIGMPLFIVGGLTTSGMLHLKDDA
ncbi:MAG: hypothetical protein ACON5B_04275 [Myxococcota bacterium]